MTQQFLDVTTRKRKSTDGNNKNPDEKKSTNTVKNQSKNVENVIRHVAGEGLESQAGLVAKYLDKKGIELAAAVTQQSKQLKENQKFTPEQTAAITSNMPDSAMDKMRTVHNNNPYSGIFPGWIFFPSRCHFFFTLMADYDQFWHVSAAFNWLHRAIMSVGPGKSKFWTRHLR